MFRLHADFGNVMLPVAWACWAIKVSGMFQLKTNIVHTRMSPSVDTGRTETQVQLLAAAVLCKQMEVSILGQYICIEKYYTQLFQLPKTLAALRLAKCRIVCCIDDSPMSFCVFFSLTSRKWWKDWCSSTSTHVPRDGWTGLHTR